MRKSRWAEPEETEEKRDEPVTLTESQYRALKRGALLGPWVSVLGLVGTGLAVWSLARTPGNEANPTVAQAAMAPETAPAPDTVAAAPMPSPIAPPEPDSRDAQGGDGGSEDEHAASRGSGCDPGEAP
jgi:hypothetical protein